MLSEHTPRVGLHFADEVLSTSDGAD